MLQRLWNLTTSPPEGTAQKNDIIVWFYYWAFNPHGRRTVVQLTEVNTFRITVTRRAALFDRYEVTLERVDRPVGEMWKFQFRLSAVWCARQLAAKAREHGASCDCWRRRRG